MKKLICLMIPVFIILFFITGCTTSGSDDTSQIAGQLTTTLAKGNQAIYEANYDYYLLNHEGETSKFSGSFDEDQQPVISDDERVIPILLSEQYYDSRFRSLQRKTYRISPQNLETFLQNDWKTYQESLGEEFDARLFIDYLLSSKIPHSLFFELYDQSEVSVEEMIAIIDSTKTILKDNESRNLVQLTYMLDDLKVEMKELISVLSSDYDMTYHQFVEKAYNNGYTISKIRELRYSPVYSDMSLSTFLKVIIEEDALTAKKQAGEVAFAVLDLFWGIATDIIKNQEPPEINIDEPQTNILSQKDDNTDNYTGGTTANGATYTYSGKISSTLSASRSKKFSMDYYQTGIYGAQNSEFYGYWIPSLSVQVENVELKNNCTLNATATMIGPSNIGGYYDNSADPPNPYVMTSCTFQLEHKSTLMQKSFNLDTTGKDGFE